MIVITTMDSLPELCYECPCHDGESGYCQADASHRYSDYRPFWCPLKEIVNCKDCKHATMTSDGKMPDREKVIKALEHCKDNQHVNDCDECNYGGKTGMFCVRIIDDVLSLLKEQPDIVMCKDCVFRDDRDGMCEHVQQIRDPDWYCADGKRR